MFLKETLTILTQAMKQVFTADYPTPDFRGLHIDIEYPDDPQGYPGIWVDFEPTGQLESSGIDNSFYDTDTVTGDARYWRVWRFTGYATYTIVSLSNLQRAMLYDEVIRVLAFGGELTQTSVFRQFIENNPFIAANMDFDQIMNRGATANPGTPWGTEEVIYETTLAMEVIGEFASDGLTTTLVPFKTLKLYPYITGTPNPALQSTDPAPWM